MRGRWLAGVVLALVLAAAPAQAVDDEHYSLFDPVPDDELRPLCSDNPGFGVPPCIVDAGHVIFELTAVTATFDSVAGTSTRDYAVGDILLRVGLTDTLEANASWTPLVISNVKTGALNQTSHATGSVGLGLKQSLKNPDGEGLSMAVEPSVTIPTDGGRVAWTLSLPTSQSLGNAWTLGFTPELDISPNSMDGGTHIGGSAALSLSVAVAAFNLGGEIFLAQDNDPAGTTHYAAANFSVSWEPPRDENLSFDVGADFGLNDATPDFEFYCGLTRRF